jgi:dihydrofolate reductase
MHEREGSLEALRLSADEREVVHAVDEDAFLRLLGAEQDDGRARASKIVLSRSLKSDPSKNLIAISDNLAGEVNKLKQQPGKNIIIFGSATAVRSLLKENLVDEFWLFVNPVVMGAGLSFFDGVKNRLVLKLISSRAFASGVVCLHYEK